MVGDRVRTLAVIRSLGVDFRAGPLPVATRPNDVHTIADRPIEQFEAKWGGQIRMVKRFHLRETLLALAILTMICGLPLVGAARDGNPATVGISATGDVASATLTSKNSTPMVGVVNATGQYFAQERAAGIDAVTLDMGWNDAEPSSGSFSEPYLLQIRQAIADASASGLGVVLDPGMQYPPNWVFSLPGGTRFVNQYGDVFSDPETSGDNVANAVTDSAVRSAEGAYLAWLGAHIARGKIIAIREGGGPLGELRYPDPGYDGHTDSYWAFDVSSQATSPVPGWTPRTGSVAQAKAFLNSYNSQLDRYGEWLNGQMEKDLGTTVLVMLPGWGQRPGGAALEERSRLTLDMPEFNEGLDWSELLGSLPAARRSVAYTTYLDGPDILPTIQLEDPAKYLAQLTKSSHLRLGGENTGNGTLATMDLCLDRAKALHFSIVQWMDQAQLVSSDNGDDPDGPTIDDLGAAAASVFGLLSLTRWRLEANEHSNGGGAGANGPVAGRWPVRPVNTDDPRF